MVLPVRLACVLALLAALAGPAAAAAAPRPATPLTLAVGVAQGYWHATPCGGRVALLTRQVLPDGLGGDSDAWVTFDSPLGANNLAAPAGGYANCTVALARTRWPSRASMRQDWDMLCMTVVHEYGHLLGRVHDDAPGSVMAQTFMDYSSEPSACRRTRPRSVHAH